MLDLAWGLVSDGEKGRGAYAVARVALEVADARDFHLEGAGDFLGGMISKEERHQGVRTCESVRIASTS